MMIPISGIIRVKDKDRSIYMRKKFQKLAALAAAVFILPYTTGYIRLPAWGGSYTAEKASENFISIQTEDGIREISFEDYVCGVTARDLKEDWPPEAVKAQMVITRTNLEKSLEENPGTLLSEPYLTLSQLEERGILEKMLQAAEETQGQTLTYQGHLVQAPYHAVSSGRTRSGAEAGLGDEYEWLMSAESGQDVESEQYLSVEEMDEDSVRECIRVGYPEALTDEGVLAQIEIISRDEEGYVTRVRAGEKEMTGEKFRSLLSLPSSCFFLEDSGGKIRITTKGLGHGLGLSLYGARRMAEAGAGYQEILGYYFENCSITAALQSLS